MCLVDGTIQIFAQPVLAGASGNPGEVGVDDGDLHSALHQIDDPVTVEAVGIRVEGLVSPDDAVFRNGVTRVVIALGEELRAVHHACVADHARHRCNARQVAGVACKVRNALVGRADARVQSRDLVDVAARPLAACDLVGAVGVGDALELLDDDVICLVPRNLDELVLAPVLAGALHGIRQAVLVVHQLGHVQAAHAQTALRERVLGVALHLDQLAVRIGVQQDTAPQVTARTRPGASARDGVFPLLVLIRLLMRDQDPL